MPMDDILFDYTDIKQHYFQLVVCFELNWSWNTLVSFDWTTHFSRNITNCYWWRDLAIHQNNIPYLMLFFFVTCLCVMQTLHLILFLGYRKANTWWAALLPTYRRLKSLSATSILKSENLVTTKVFSPLRFKIVFRRTHLRSALF